jgi:hypothetical protein
MGAVTVYMDASEVLYKTCTDTNLEPDAPRLA